MTFELVAATANPGKVAEIAAILADVVTLLPRPDSVGDVVEDAPDLVGNARLKAVAISQATGLASVADDTGLEVDALDGAPGVFSARYAGEQATNVDNVAKLLTELTYVGPDDRTARFRTAAVVSWPDGQELVVHGIVEGRITAAPRGEGGFGLRRRVRASRRRRLHLRRDVGGSKERDQPPWPSVPSSSRSPDVRRRDRPLRLNCRA